MSTNDNVDALSWQHLVFRVTVSVLALIALQVTMATCWKTALQNRETKRRFQHAYTGMIMVQVSYILPLYWCIAALLGGALGIWILCIYAKPTYLQYFGTLLRPSEHGNHLPGAFYFLLGTAATLLLVVSSNDNDITIARYSVLCLSLADPVAAWVGQTIVSPKLVGSASLAGSAACFAVSYGIGRFVYDISNKNNHGALVGALACTLAEALPILWNDNFSIPVLTALAVQMVR